MIQLNCKAKPLTELSPPEMDLVGEEPGTGEEGAAELDLEGDVVCDTATTLLGGRVSTLGMTKGSVEEYESRCRRVTSSQCCGSSLAEVHITGHFVNIDVLLSPSTMELTEVTRFHTQKPRTPPIRNSPNNTHHHTDVYVRKCRSRGEGRCLFLFVWRSYFQVFGHPVLRWYRITCGRAICRLRRIC